MSIRPFILIMLAGLLALPGCDIIIGIFKAGFWTAIFLIVLVLFLIAFAVYKLRD